MKHCNEKDGLVYADLEVGDIFRWLGEIADEHHIYIKTKKSNICLITRQYTYRAVGTPCCDSIYMGSAPVIVFPDTCIKLGDPK